MGRHRDLGAPACQPSQGLRACVHGWTTKQTSKPLRSAKCDLLLDSNQHSIRVFFCSLKPLHITSEQPGFHGHPIRSTIVNRFLSLIGEAITATVSIPAPDERTKRSPRVVGSTLLLRIHVKQTPKVFKVVEGLFVLAVIGN